MSATEAAPVTITGTAIRQIRTEKGLLAQYVASRSGMSKQQFSEIEGGTRRIEVNEFIAIARAMGLKPGDLLENSGSVREDLKPIVADLQHAHPITLKHVREFIRLIDAVATAANEEVHT